jgi:DNA-binding SARP family transcriptional activator
MSAPMKFCLLGPLVVRIGETLIPVQPGKQRTVLSALLLNANQVVPVDELAEALWGCEPPPSAQVSIRNYVKRLRRALGDAERARIATRPRGYMITVTADELDLTRFEVLLGTARAAARNSSWDIASTQASAALSLWRGEPLADVESDALALREIPRLMEMRLQALEARIDADLHLGSHADVVAELQRLAYSHPLREHLHALLMLALYRDGQQANALAAYRHTRRVLIEELGTEPGTELRHLHHQILAADTALAVPERTRLAVADAALLVPRQLPAVVRYFPGRAAELAALTRQLAQAGDDTPGTVVISAIGGMAGVGKTALAVCWAHQVAERFPDGQLYVNLHGYDVGQPLTAADALAGFLRALGVSAAEMPPGADERAARYRSLLAGRRMLVVLDNAGEAGQVRPLLPGTQTCVAVVTSRDSLAGLVARDGAQRLDLDLLPLGAAISLLRALIGERVDADPAAAAALADQCCRLPLALRIAAELAARPAVALADLAGELADQQRRLDLLETGGDPFAAVRAVFSWSCRHLDPATARMFRLMSLHPGADLDRYAAAALTGTTAKQAGLLLGQLADAYLIQPTSPGRYGMHDLLRDYARELTAREDGEDARRAALTRLFSHYLDVVTAATGILFPTGPGCRPGAPPVTPGAVIPDAAAARAWLDTELATLVAVVAHAAADGLPGHATGLAAIMFRYLDVGGYYAEAVAIHGHARDAAAHAGNRAAEAAALTNLGVAEHEQGCDHEATKHLQQAAALFRTIGDRAGQARALSNLGHVRLLQGRY